MRCVLQSMEDRHTLTVSEIEFARAVFRDVDANDAVHLITVRLRSNLSKSAVEA